MSKPPMSLRFTHPTQDLGLLVEKLELSPDVIWRVGDPRRTPNGRELGGFRDCSYAALGIGDDDGSVEETISRWCDSLDQSAALLGDLTSTGGRIDFYITLGRGDALEIPAGLISRLAALQIDLGIDVHTGHAE